VAKNAPKSTSTDASSKTPLQQETERLFKAAAASLERVRRAKTQGGKII